MMGKYQPRLISDDGRFRVEYHEGRRVPFTVWDKNEVVRFFAKEQFCYQYIADRNRNS